MSRLFIYTKDVQLLTGRSQKVALRILAEIRKKFNKTRNDMVTVIEFCEWTRLDLKMVIEHLR